MIIDLDDVAASGDDAGGDYQTIFNRPLILLLDYLLIIAYL